MDELIDLFIDLLEILETSDTDFTDDHSHSLFDSDTEDMLWNLKDKLEMLKNKERMK